MAYFSNGTEGEIYQEQYCYRCQNWNDEKGCPIMDLHLLWNYDAIDEPAKEMALDTFIPRSKDGIGNEQCLMFKEKTYPNPYQPHGGK